MKGLDFYILLAIIGLCYVACNEDQDGRKTRKLVSLKESISEPSIFTNVSSFLDPTNTRDKIVGGTKVSKGEFPWVAGIWRLKSVRPFCGGSLLNNRYVLVALYIYIYIYIYIYYEKSNSIFICIYLSLSILIS